MYSQKRIIKMLISVVTIQLILFLSYYLHINLKTKSYYSSIISVNRVPVSIPPISNNFNNIKIFRDGEVVKDRMVKIQRIAPVSSEDIVPMNNKKVKPILYTNPISLSSLTIKEKKQKFIDMMVPSILVAKYQLKCDRERVLKLIILGDIDKEDEKWLNKKEKEFKALNNYELYNKMKEHPTSIIIAQAIIESGWGTSKFFQKANNIFGVWSFDENDKRLAASKKRGNKTIYLKKYSSMEESIYDYLLTLSRGDYESFRKQRLETQDPYKLANYLIKYSEEGKKYTKSLKEMIKKNKLIVYDSYQLDI